MTFIGHFQSNPFYDSKSGSLDVFIEGIIFSYMAQILSGNTGFGEK